MQKADKHVMVHSEVQGVSEHAPPEEPRLAHFPAWVSSLCNM